MKCFTKFSTLALMALGLSFMSSCTDDKFTTETIDFQSVELESESYWNGSDGSGGMTIEKATFNNSYNADWGSWSGFAFSNVTDIETPGWANQYSAYIGSGADANNTYAVSFVTGEVASITFSSKVNMVSAKFTNSTYPYLSMLNGDGYAKKFEDGDWFKLTITGYNDAEQVATFDYYLADYRNSETNIIEDWTKVNLDKFEGINKLVFTLSSTDNGDYGMNTPAYFCMDDLVYKFME